MDAHSFVARNFAHLYVVGGRQHSMDAVAKMQRKNIALLWTWMSCMKATLKGIGFIESIEIDGGAFMQAGIVTYVLAQTGTSTGAYGVRSRTTA